MARRPLKKTAKKSSPHQRSSAAPEATPAVSTPRRSFPLNTLLRALSTPPRPPSHHPFLRAFSTPVRRRTEYSAVVRRLCQRGVHTRLPYDNDLFVKKILPCEGCRKVGTMTQTVVFKQGHAGEWVRACQNTVCGLVTYPAQPGTPPNLLEEIEAAREVDASSSTMPTPRSHTSGSSMSSSDAHSYDLHESPGGELEDWLTPLFQEIDMELASRPSKPSDSPSPGPIAGSSSGAGFNAHVSPQCARDEEIARHLQVAFNEEDAMLLQRLETSPAESQPPTVSDRGQSQAMLSSLTAELATIMGTNQSPGEAPTTTSRSSAHENPNQSPSCSSRESSPSPRPRKKKRILIHPTPPPPVRRRIRGPVPSVPTTKGQDLEAASNKGKVSQSRTVAASGARQSDNPAPPNVKGPMALARPAPSPEDDAPSPVIIIISSDDEPEDDTNPCNRHASHASLTHPKIASDESSVIDITSSESDSDKEPPATQPRLSRSRAADRPRAPSRDVQTRTRRARRDIDSDSEDASPAIQPRRPRLRAINRSRAPSRDIPACTRRARRDIDSNSEDAPPATQPRLPRSRAANRPRAPSRDVQIRTRRACRDIDGDSEGAPPAIQPRLPRSRAIDKSRAPSCDIQARTRITRDDSHLDDVPAAQPQSSRSRALRKARAASSEVQDPVPAIHDGADLNSELRAAGSASNLQMVVRSSPAIANVPSATSAQEATESWTSNKENEASDAAHSHLDRTTATRLSARQAVARRHVGLFASLAQTSSSLSANEEDEEFASVPGSSPPPEVQSRPQGANGVVNATEVFGHPFRFELWPAVPELAHNIDPDLGDQHWILTVKIWYKNNMPPSTKMVAFDHPRCSIRLSEIFIIARTFQYAGIDNFRIWNKFTTDWDARSLYDYIPISITDNHTLLIRFPTVATLASWIENVSQSYGSCQTVDPRHSGTRKGKGVAYD